MQENKTQDIHSFTLKGKGLLNILHTPIEISKPDDLLPKNRFKTRGIWDTGASGSVITKEVVEYLDLKPSGQSFVNTASESNRLTDTFKIDLYLKNDLRIKCSRVTLGKIFPGIDCLIGMDVINLGDFSITNFQKETCMSFRIPSLHEIDYRRDPKFRLPYVNTQHVNRNDPCPCGSGLKYKKCHGK